MTEPDRTLRGLARAFGVELDFRDVWGGLRRPDRDTLVAVLRSLGAEMEGAGEAGSALRARLQQLQRQVIPPVAVSWQGEADRLPLRLPGTGDTERLTWRVRLENGGQEEGTEVIETRPRPALDGAPLRSGGLPLPCGLACGYHRLTVETDCGVTSEALLLVAPSRIRQPASPATGRGWGLFLPLYALRSERPGGGIGDLAHLRELVSWCSERGGSALGLLPVLATPPGEASPYAPSSRRMWDPRHADLDAAVAELRDAGADVAIDAGERETAARLAAADRVDHAAVDDLKGRILGRLAGALLRLPPEAPLRARLRDRLDADEELRAWGTFLRARHRHGADWRRWPTSAAAIPGRAVPAADVWWQAVYSQWLIRRQWQSAAAHAAAAGVDLYLDLPLGVPPDSFDVWRRPEAFARGCSIGAPPDSFFVEGQNWGFAPPHPENGRAAASSDWAAAVRHQLRVARVLRIDHVMGLHRLWWVPDGASAERGAYVRYHAAERFAVLAIEAQRAEAAVIGEDLGTVPAVVRERMDRRGVRRMWILQAEAGAGEPPGVPEPPAESLVGLETHDMPPFAAWWRGDDLEWLQRLGRLDPESAAREGQRRERQRHALRAGAGFESPRLEPAAEADDPMLDEAARLLGPWLVRLAAARGELLVIGLEDLWLETRPQNVPGHTDPDGDLPCWRNRARRSLEELRDDPVVAEVLAAVDRARRGRD